MNWSVVIPVHNEAANLEGAVDLFIRSLPKEIEAIIKEIVLVENGSTDGTIEVCERLHRRYPALIRICTIPRGSYGEAIKRGMLESRGTHLSILECDFLDPEFVSTSSRAFQAQRAQFIVGSKRHPRSVDRRPLKRRVLTTLYNVVFLRFFIGYPGSDTHGLKSIETPLAKKLCELAVTTDEVFQTELVLLAWRLGYKIEEIPIRISEMRRPSVTILRRIPKVVNTVRALQKSLGRFSQSQAETEWVRS
jgi:hypothetical protein